MSARQREEVFVQFARWGFDQKGWSPRTRAKYAMRARAADRWLQENRGTSLLWARPKDLQTYLFSTSPTAINRNNIRQALVGFCAFLVDAGWTETNAAVGLPRLPQPDAIPKALSIEQARRIEAVTQTLPPRGRALMLVYLYTGLRKSEARLLEWRHIDEDFAWLRFAGKGDKVREVPLHDVPSSALRMLRVAGMDPRWCFPSYRSLGGPVSDSWVAALVREVGETAGVERLHPHALRHTAATLAYEASGGDIRTVQVFLGHASPQTTAIYARVRPSRLEDLVERMSYRAEA